jgi:hypothetical protein
MEVTSQLHAPAVLLPEKEPTVGNEYEFRHFEEQKNPCWASIHESMAF